MATEERNHRAPSASISRRTVVAGSAGLIAMAAIGRRANAAGLDKLTVRLNWSSEGLHAPFHLANQKGWFKNAGLEVAVEDGNGSVTTVQLVGSGQFDIGHAALASMATGAAKGLPVTSVAGVITRSDVGICVPKDAPWSKPTDLVGKKVCYTAGSLEGPFIRPFFDNNGVPSDQVQLINVEASAKLSTYASKTADALSTTVPWFLPILADSRPSKGILFADFGLDLPGNGLVVNTENQKTKGDAIKRFTSVFCATWTYILDGHEEEGVKAVQAARPQGALTAAKMLAQIEEYRPYFRTKNNEKLTFGFQSEDDWVSTIHAMENAGVIPKGTKPGQYFSNTYIDLAYGKKIVAA
jgi:NitT/TauT family transport system substrate-binding protein